MYECQARDDEGYYAGLWEDMIKAHERRVEREIAVEERCAARTAGTDQGRHVLRAVRRAQRLSSKGIYGKTAIAQCATLDTASPAVPAKLLELHPDPMDPVSIIPERDIPPKPVVSPDRVHAAISEMDMD